MPSVRSTTDIIPGYYTVRVARGGIPVPARIFMACACTVTGGEENKVHDWTEECDRSPTLIGMICGEPCEALKVWLSGSLKMIGQKEYELLVAQAAWDKQWDKDAPLANPRQPVDFLKVKLPF